VDVDGIEVSTGVCNFLLGAGVVNDKDDDIVEDAGCRCEDDETIDFETGHDCNRGVRYDVDNGRCLFGVTNGGDKNRI